jgi:hypothetical protein
MQNISLKNIEAATFRANPNYELVLFDRLPLEQQEVLGSLQNDPDFYGILRSRQPSGLGIKSVCRDTALLYLTLQQAGQLPAYVKTMFGNECNQAIAELVLDGILEIEQNGTFVAGADAFGLIYGEDSSATAPGKVARLSIEALKYVQALEINDSLKLSARLYLYNRLPLSPRWKRMFPTPEAVAEHLGVQVGGANRPLLEKHWSRVPLAPPNDWWLMWRSRQARSESRKKTCTYKLYISPSCEFVRDAFQATTTVLSELQALCFKIGKDVYGMLRPDKLVAYFASFEELQEAANRLRLELEGCPAHGVPFTSEITNDGLLSWGMDPPGQQPLPLWQEHESWRLWVTNRLATAMLMAKAAGSKTVEPWQFALERLRLEGVDTESWTPAQTIWREHTVVEA